MDPVLQRLEAIESKLDRVLFPQAINIQEVMRLTGFNSTTAQHRWNRRHGVKAYTRGKYRRSEIENKIAHLRLFPSKTGKLPAKAVAAQPAA